MNRIERVVVDECVGQESPLVGQLRERLAKPICGYFQNFALIRFASRIGQRCGTHEHCNVPDETART